MPFDPNRLALTVDSIGGGSLRIHFLRTDDDRDEVTAPGYLRFASRLGVRGGDVVIVYNEADASLDTGTYLTRVAPDFINGHATLIEDVGEKPLPPFHFRVNDGEGSVSATYDQARVLLDVDRLPNKSEEEMVASGAIGEALGVLSRGLATKATPADITDALRPVISEVATKATPEDIDERLAPVVTNVTNLGTSSTAQAGRLTALETGQKSDRITRGLYSEILALTLVADATYEVLDRDTGTHPGIPSEDGYSPDTGRVPNAGIFIPQGNPLVPRRIGGTSVSAIPQLVADNATLRATRYVARPGEDIRGWTAQTLALPEAATPLSVSPGYALTPGVGGKALRITGEINAGPIALTRIEPGLVHRVGPIRIASGAGAGRTARLRSRCFSNTGADLNIVNIANVALPDSAIVPLSYTISTVPGAADVLFPDPAGGDVRVYLGGLSATDVVDVYELPRPAVPSDLTTALKAAPKKTVFADGDLIPGLAAADGSLFTATALDFKLMMEAYLAPPPTYYFPASGRFGTTPSPLIPATTDGAIIRRATVKNESQDTTQFVAVAFGGRQAALFTEGSYTFAAGAGQNFEDLPPGPVSVVTSGSSVPVTCDLWSTTNVDPSSSLRSAAHLARYQGGNLNDVRRKAISDFYNYAYDDDWIDFCKGGGYIWVGRAPGNFDGLIDWANPARTFGRIALDGAPFPDTSVAGTVFNGSNAIDTGIVPVAAKASAHALLGWSDTTIQTGKIAVGNTALKLNPNRAASSAGFSSGGATVVVTPVSPGGLQGFRRSGTAITYFRNETLKTPYTQDVAANLGSTSLYIGGQHGSSGLVNGYTGTLELDLFAVNGVPTDDHVNRLFAAFSTFRTALGA